MSQPAHSPGSRCFPHLAGDRQGERVGLRPILGLAADANERGAAIRRVPGCGPSGGLVERRDGVSRVWVRDRARGAWTSKAVAVLIPGFALYHGLDPQQVLGMLAGGTTLMLLRLHSDALWLPLGYHWAWNVLQTAVFGAPGPHPRFGRSRCRVLSAGWVGQVPPNQGCRAHSFIWRWRCSSGCGHGAALPGAVEDGGCKRLIPRDIIAVAALSRAACRGGSVRPSRGRERPGALFSCGRGSCVCATAAEMTDGAGEYCGSRRAAGEYRWRYANVAETP